MSDKIVVSNKISVCMVIVDKLLVSSAGRLMIALGKCFLLRFGDFYQYTLEAVGCNSSLYSICVNCF